MPPRFIIVVAFAMLIPSTVLRSQEVAPHTFSKGTWSIQTYASYTAEFAPGDDVKLASGTVGVGYYVWDNIAFNLELPVLRVDQPGDDASAIGLNLLLRQHLFTRDRFSLYADVAGGLFEADGRVPAAGTNFNFTFQTGLGVTYRLWDNVHLMAGVRYFHLSNARLEGPEHNPNLNAVGGYVGLLFLF